MRSYSRKLNNTVKRFSPWRIYLFGFLLLILPLSSNAQTPDTTPPNPVDEASIFSSHEKATWENIISSFNQVDVIWNEPTDNDGGSGLAGYAIVWDNNPITDSTTWPADAELIPTTDFGGEYTSPELADGTNHWFHIRSVDNAGNLLNNTIHYGPVYIDTTPPTDISNLTTSTHHNAIGTWHSESNKNVVTLTWDPAGDTGSGITAYRVIWESDAGTLHETNVTGTTVSSPPLGDGKYLISVLAADEAGNVSSGITLSELVYVDTTPPALTALDQAIPVTEGTITMVPPPPYVFDNEDPQPTVIYTLPPDVIEHSLDIPATFSVGITTVMYIVRDGAGNENSKTIALSLSYSRKGAGLVGNRQLSDNDIAVLSVGDAIDTDAAVTNSKPVRDILVSPDGYRAYAIGDDEFLVVYQVNAPTELAGAPGVTFLAKHAISLDSPKSMAITPDAAFLFICGNDRIIGVNTQQISTVDAAGNWNVIPPLAWGGTGPTGIELAVVPSVSELAVSPSGTTLYYLVETNKGFYNQSQISSPVFGAVGALDISDLPSTVPSPALWEEPITVNSGSSAGDLLAARNIKAFYAPFSLALSPDGDYALISAEGREQAGQITPFGLIPRKDDATGGILVLDLQHHDFIQFIPSVVQGEDSRLINRMIRHSANGIVHPQVFRAEQQEFVAQAGTAASSFSPFSLSLAVPAEVTFRQIAGIMEETFSDFGLLVGYNQMYSANIVGASDVAISPSGNLGLVTYKSTNNIGILALEPSTTLNGYDRDSIPDFHIQGVIEKTVDFLDLKFGISGTGGNITSELHNRLHPEEVAFTSDGERALVGTDGGVVRDDGTRVYGEIDVTTLRHRVNEFTDTVSDSGLSAGLLRLQAHNEITRPRNVTTFWSVDADHDGISDHLEAYNRFNFLETSGAGSLSSGNLISAHYNSQLSNPGQPLLDKSFEFLLPPKGLGYTFKGGPLEGAHVGNVATLMVIESIGREWQKNHRQGISGFTNHSHFVIRNISQLGGGTMVTVNGEVASAFRTGFEFTIPYFHTDGSDKAVNFVESNSPPDESDNTCRNNDDYDWESGLTLIKLFLTHPDVQRVAIDVAVRDVILDNTSLPAIDLGAFDKMEIIGFSSTDPDETSVHFLDEFMRIEVVAAPEIVVQNGMVGDDGVYRIAYNSNDPAANIHAVDMGVGGRGKSVKIRLPGSGIEIYESNSGGVLTGLINDGDVYRIADLPNRLWLKLAGINDNVQFIMDFYDNDDGTGPIVDTVGWEANSLEVVLSLAPATLTVNTTNKDNDGVPDYADGYNLDGMAGTADDGMFSAGFFNDLTVEFKGNIDFERAVVRLMYDDSYPDKVVFPGKHQFSGHADDYKRPSGRFRLWRVGEPFLRDKRSALNTDNGDFVPSA